MAFAPLNRSDRIVLLAKARIEYAVIWSPGGKFDFSHVACCASSREDASKSGQWRRIANVLSGFIYNAVEKHII